MQQEPSRQQAEDIVRQNLSNAVSRALAIFTPPERLTVSEWADKYRVMSSQETSRPGMWDTNNVPYMRFIMDCFNKDEIEQIVWLKCTQIGGTEAMLNMVGYTISQNPSRIMYVLPDDNLIEQFSELRLQRMIGNCPTLAEKVDSRNSVDLIKYQGGFLVFASSRSPSALASWSVPILFLDEIDKFPIFAGKEASPIKLASERLKNWPIRKMFMCSTPTLKTGNIYTAYEAADVRYRYYVPCPHCGKLQTLEFGGIKWPKNEEGHSDVTTVRYSAYYECTYCGGRIDDRHKMQMLKQGKWIAENQVAGIVSKVGFSISSLYSPWVTFGRIASEFLSSKDNPTDLQNFVNSWLGEPWENKADTLDADIVLSKESDLDEGVVPEWAQLLTAGVDVQKNGYYWTIRAWGYRITSQNIAHGYCETLEEIEEIMNRHYPDSDGELRWQVQLCAIDSGYKTDEIYEFCLYNGDWAVPVKGAANSQKIARYTRSNIDASGKSWNGQGVYVINTDQYKDFIYAHLRRPLGEGCWMIYNGCDRRYAEMITAEHKIETIKNNRRIASWVPKSSGIDNHYLDTEVYAALAADLLSVRYLGEQVQINNTSAQHQGRKQSNDEFGDDWLGV